jgi:hypothetical protein
MKRLERYCLKGIGVPILATVKKKRKLGKRE